MSFFRRTPREVSADVQQVSQLEHLDRKLPVNPSQLVVDDAVLDRRGHTRGHAPQEAQLVCSVGPPALARSQAERRDRVATAMDRQQKGQAMAVVRLDPRTESHDVVP